MDNRLSLPYFGRLSAVSMDPIEKKPLYHFYPGKQILSVGFFGCNLSCPFCQNYSISKQPPGIFETQSAPFHEFDSELPGRFLSPRELIAQAVAANSFGIAYTYSEPLIHFEYILECAREAADAGLKNVLISNGFINKKPAAELFSAMDAANIDLKGFTDGFYRDELGGKLQPVLDAIAVAAEHVALEITTLVIPGKNSSLQEISQIAHFIASINADIPLHLSRYHPAAGYTVPATNPDSLMKLVDTARNYLNFVYPGNLGSVPADTCCPQCKHVLIKRTGYTVSLAGVKGSGCANCGYKIPFPVRQETLQEPGQTD